MHAKLQHVQRLREKCAEAVNRAQGDVGELQELAIKCLLICKDVWKSAGLRGVNAWEYFLRSVFWKVEKTRYPMLMVRPVRMWADKRTALFISSSSCKSHLVLGMPRLRNWCQVPIAIVKTTMLSPARSTLRMTLMLSRLLLSAELTRKQYSRYCGRVK